MPEKTPTSPEHLTEATIMQRKIERLAGLIQENRGAAERPGGALDKIGDALAAIEDGTERDATIDAPEDDSRPQLLADRPKPIWPRPAAIVPRAKREAPVGSASSITTSAKAKAPHSLSEARADSHETEPLSIRVGYREKKDSYHDVSEDYLVVDVENGIFAVFDGMGGMGGKPEAASRAAGEAVHESLLKAKRPTDRQDLSKSLFEAFIEGRKNVTANGEGGSTVGTAIQFAQINGETYMGVAHAGDTRLFTYHYDKDDYRELTTDQSKGNLVSNAFESGKAGNGLDEYMLFQIKKGVTRRFAICSDGITGDWPNQFLTHDEMKEAFKQPTPDDAAQRFLDISKKPDDKTIVVIEIDT